MSSNCSLSTGLCGEVVAQLNVKIKSVLLPDLPIAPSRLVFPKWYVNSRLAERISYSSRSIDSTTFNLGEWC